MTIRCTILAAALLAPLLAGASETAIEAIPVETALPSRSIPPPISEPMPFVDGEKLIYAVSLLGMKAGQAELRVEAMQGDAWRLHASGQTVGATDSIFGLRQSASCTVSAELTPELCLFTSRQRKSMKRREMRFDKATGEVRERTLEDGKRSERSRNYGDGGVQDALSGIYLLRRDLPAAGETMRFRSMRKGKPISVEATGIGPEQVETGAGSFAAFLIELRVIDGADKDLAKGARVWFSADERRLPLKISLAAPVGSLVAELEAATGTLVRTVVR